MELTHSFLQQSITCESEAEKQAVIESINQAQSICSNLRLMVHYYKKLPASKINHEVLQILTKIGDIDDPLTYKFVNEIMLKI